MARQHAQGFFCAALDGEPAALPHPRATLWDGREVEFDDPYRFGPLISDSDLYLHTEGTLYEALAHARRARADEPTASRACASPCGRRTRRTSPLAGEFNDWDIRRHPMRRRNGGVWEIFVPGLGEGAAYKYNVRSRFAGYQQLKADPYAFYCETPPKSASVVWDHRALPVERRRVDGARAPRPTC